MTSPVPTAVFVGETYVADAIAAAIAALPPNRYPVVFSGTGTLSTITGGLKFRVKVPHTIDSVTADVGTASTVIITTNVRKGTTAGGVDTSASIFASTPHQPIIPIGALQDDGVVDTTSMAVDEWLEVDYSTSGGTPGQNITVTVWLIPLA